MFTRESPSFSTKRRAAFLGIYAALKFLTLFLSILTSSGMPNFDTTLRITTPAMPPESYLSLFETEDEESSATVSRLLTDFGVASGPRPALQIVYNEFHFTTNSTFDTMTAHHDRQKQSLCYVVLMAGLNPGLASDVTYLWDQYIRNATLTHFDACSLSSPPASSYTNTFYDGTIEAWLYDLTLFVVFSITALVHIEEEALFFTLLFYFWIVYCAEVTFCFFLPLARYKWYLADRQQFLPAQIDYLRASNLLSTWDFEIVSRANFGAWAVIRPALIPVLPTALYTAIVLLFPFFWVSKFPSAPHPTGQLGKGFDDSKNGEVYGYYPPSKKIS